MTTFPDEPHQTPAKKLPTLRCCSGDTTQYDTPRIKYAYFIQPPIKKRNDKKMTMKMIARDAIIWNNMYRRTIHDATQISTKI